VNNTALVTLQLLTLHSFRYLDVSLNYALTTIVIDGSQFNGSVYVSHGRVLFPADNAAHPVVAVFGRNPNLQLLQGMAMTALHQVQLFDISNLTIQGFNNVQSLRSKLQLYNVTNLVLAEAAFVNTSEAQQVIYERCWSTTLPSLPQLRTVVSIRLSEIDVETFPPGFMERLERLNMLIVEHCDNLLRWHWPRSITTVTADVHFLDLPSLVNLSVYNLNTKLAIENVTNLMITNLPGLQRLVMGANSSVYQVIMTNLPQAEYDFGGLQLKVLTLTNVNLTSMSSFGGSPHMVDVHLTDLHLIREIGPFPLAQTIESLRVRQAPRLTVLLLSNVGKCDVLSINDVPMLQHIEAPQLSALSRVMVSPLPARCSWKVTNVDWIQVSVINSINSDCWTKLEHVGTFLLNTNDTNLEVRSSITSVGTVLHITGDSIAQIAGFDQLETLPLLNVSGRNASILLALPFGSMLLPDKVVLAGNTTLIVPASWRNVSCVSETDPCFRFYTLTTTTPAPVTSTTSPIPKGSQGPDANGAVVGSIAAVAVFALIMVLYCFTSRNQQRHGLDAVSVAALHQGCSLLAEQQYGVGLEAEAAVLRYQQLAVDYVFPRQTVGGRLCLTFDKE
jgi:hypothetical protein